MRGEGGGGAGGQREKSRKVVTVGSSKSPSYQIRCERKQSWGVRGGSAQPQRRLELPRAEGGPGAAGGPAGARPPLPPAPPLPGPPGCACLSYPR